MQIDPSYRAVANRFFREAWQRKSALRDRIDEIWEKDWKAPGASKSDLRANFVDDYTNALLVAGNFQPTSSGELARTRISPTQTYEILSYLLQPVSIGQRRDGQSDYYVEEMAMLVRAGAEVSRKKVIAHQAPLCLLFSRHFLERLFARGAVGADIGVQLKDDSLEIARRLAFALSVGLAKTEVGEDGGQSAFIPYREGLIIFASKVLAGRTFDENFGWKFDFTGQKYTRLYVKKDLIERLPNLRV